MCTIKRSWYNDTHTINLYGKAFKIWRHESSSYRLKPKHHGTGEANFYSLLDNCKYSGLLQ